VIPLDAAYSPVTRVRYKIEDTRVGQRTNYDKLNLEVWTTGRSRRKWRWSSRRRFSASTSIRSSAIASRPELPPEGGLRECSKRPVMRRSTSSSRRSWASRWPSSPFGSRHQLSRIGGINTVRDLVTRSEDQLLQVRNFGETTLQEVRERLSTIGLRLGMKLPHQSSIARARDHATQETWPQAGRNASHRKALFRNMASH